MADIERRVEGRYKATFGAGEGSDLNHPILEELLHANSDIEVVRTDLGDVNILQQLPNGHERLLTISVSKSHHRPKAIYPDVTIAGKDWSSPHKELSYIVIYSENDKSLHVEAQPSGFCDSIPAMELATTASRGLELLQAAIEQEAVYKFDNGTRNRESRVRDGFNPQKLRRDVAAEEYSELPVLSRLVENIDDAGSHSSFALDAIQRALEEPASWEETPPPNIS